MQMTIYTTENCPRCHILADAFRKANLDYIEKKLDPISISDCLCETGELVNAAPLVRDGAVWFFASDFFDTAGNLLANWLQVLNGIKPKGASFGGIGGQGQDIDAEKCKKIWG